MSRELEDLLKILAIAAVFFVICMVAIGRIHRLEKELERYKNAPADTVTVVRHDTIKIDSPVPVYKYIREKVVIRDTTLLTETDTVVKVIELPREHLVYKDTSYRAVVSGVQPRLDSIEVYQKNTTQTVTKYVQVPDKKRWGLGVGVGAGFNGKEVTPYVGVGVQYNIIRW